MVAWLALADLGCAALAAAGVGQTLAGLLAALRFGRQAGLPPLAAPPAVSVLKPLHGSEPLLEAALESFFRQDYPAFQLVFGVQRGDDPAIAVVRRLMTRFPQVDAALVVDASFHGPNRKVGNLINMLPSARHDVLVISDSDMHVAPGYLHQVVASLAQPQVGLVTSLYVAKPASRTLPRLLGAAYINQIFAAGVLMARGLGRQDCMGATMALTRDALARAGGLEALLPFVADDGILGRRVVAAGMRIGLARTVPETTVGEADFSSLWAHELRWARTIRAMAPAGFAASVVQYPVAWALLLAVLVGGAGWALGVLAAVCALRCVAGRLVERSLGADVTPFWLAPVRDVASVLVMAVAFLDDQVAWRGQTLTTAPDRALTARHEGDYLTQKPALAHGKG